MLEVREIYKTFNAGTINEKRAMNGVTLTLNEGDFATVIGGNGARQEQVFAARTRCDDVDRRVDTFVGELAVELELHVARALELFENHLVHLRTGVDQRRGDDRQRPFLLRVAGCTEETLGFVERVGIHTARIGQGALGRCGWSCRHVPGG